MGAFTTPFRPSDISTGLVGYWKFNNDATDSSGSGYNLTAYSTPTYTANANYWKDEYCANLNGTAYFEATNASAPNLGLVATSWTVGFQLKKNTATDFYIQKFDGGSGGWMFRIATDESMNVYQGGWISGTAGFIVPNKWQFVYVVYDRVAHKMNFFIDGNLVESITANNDAGSHTGPFDIAPITNVTSIKDVGIWNVALTPLQIKSLALGVDLSKYAYRPNNVSTQPTHWWKLNEVSGNRADSVSTNPLTLTDNNTVLSSGGYVEGVSAKCTDGTGQFLSCADSADFYFNGNFTIRQRIKFVSYSNNNAIGLMSQRTDVSNWWNFRYYNWYIHNASRNFRFYVDISSSYTIDLAFTNTAVQEMTTGVWYDVILKRSGNDFSLYLDGVLVQTQASATAMPNLTGDFRIGRDAEASDADVTMIEDVAIWKGYALTDAEIKSLACALPIQRQGIVSYWKGEDVNDSIGTNTLTNNGTVTFDAAKVNNGPSISSGKYLSLANNDSIDIVSDLTLISWAKAANWGAALTPLIAKSAYNDANGYCLFASSTNHPGITIKGALLYSTGTLVNGSWHHIVGVFDGAIKATYLDGAFQVSDAQTTAPSDTTNALYIGYETASSYYNVSQQDEILLCKRYFRPEEIKAVYLKGLNGKEATSSEIAESNILKVAGVAYASISKVASVAIASIGKVCGLA